MSHRLVMRKSEALRDFINKTTPDEEEDRDEFKSHAKQQKWNESKPFLNFSFISLFCYFFHH
jgi:hypothetical protein